MQLILILTVWRLTVKSLVGSTFVSINTSSVLPKAIRTPEYKIAGETSYFHTHLQQYYNFAMPMLSDIVVDKYAAKAAHIKIIEL